MEFQPFGFQSRSALKLSERIPQLMHEEEASHILLEMPMASGKTSTCALAINHLIENGENIAFIFISKGDLPKQANKSFHKLLSKKGNIYNLQDVKSLEHLTSGSVLTVGWEILNNSLINSLGELELTSRHVTGDESSIGLRQLIANTIEKGIKVIIFADEVHEFIFTPASQEIVKMFSPSIVVGVTATPKDKNREIANYTIKVDYDEVKETGLIKQGIYINKNLESFNHLEDEEAVLESAYARYLERKAAYELLNIDINPLILVQLPSDNQLMQDSDRLTLKRVQDFFEKKGITEANGLFAKWFSGERSACVDNGELQKNNGKPVVLVFKTAVATGIDIPRASVLAIFRKSGSITLSTQVAGRIMRQPTLKIMGDDLLDSSDIITNLSTDMIQFEGADVGKIFRTATVNLKPEIASVQFNLPNVKMFATRKPMLDLKAEGLIIDKASPLVVKAKDGFEFNVIAQQKTLGENEVESDIKSVVDGLSHSSTNINLLQSEYTINKTFREWTKNTFNDMVVDTSQVYKLVTRGINVLEDVLAEIGISKNDVPKFIVGSATNANKLSVIIKDTINQLIKSGKLKATRNISESIYYGMPTSQNYLVEGVEKVSTYEKNAYNGIPLTFDSLAEKAFDSFIDGQSFVKAWGYNLPKEDQSLGIKYSSKDKQTGIVKEAVMYPDRLILLADNTLLMAEVKSGITSIEAGDKSNALQAYITKVNQMIENGEVTTDITRVIGGIVDVDKTNGNNTYRVFTGADYSADRNHEGWKELTSIVPESSKTAGKAAKMAELEKQLAELKA